MLYLLLYCYFRKECVIVFISLSIFRSNGYLPLYDLTKNIKILAWGRFYRLYYSTFQYTQKKNPCLPQYGKVFINLIRLQYVVLIFLSIEVFTLFFLKITFKNRTQKSYWPNTLQAIKKNTFPKKRKRVQLRYNRTQ